MGTLFVENQAGKIAYEVTGEGPLVICVPGMGDLRQEYRFLAPQLVQAGYRVATMDVRGHGESSTRWVDFSVAGIGSDILALVRTLDEGPAIIAGASMAGGAAVWAAAESASTQEAGSPAPLVGGLILLDPAVRGVPGRLMQLLLSLLFARPWGPALWQRYYTSLYRTRKPSDFPAYPDRLRRNLAQPGRMEALAAMMKASQAAAAERLPQARVPAVVLMGSQDPDFKDPAAAAPWNASPLQADCHIIDGAGHYPHVEMPEIATPIIINFLNRLNNETIDGWRLEYSTRGSQVKTGMNRI